MNILHAEGNFLNLSNEEKKQVLYLVERFFSYFKTSLTVVEFAQNTGSNFWTWNSSAHITVYNINILKLFMRQM